MSDSISADHASNSTATASPHTVRVQAIAEVGELDRLRLVGPDSDATHVERCPCGWTTATEAGRTSAHLDRDPALPVHAVAVHSLLGSRRNNADSYATAVDDTTGVAAFAVADGIGDSLRAARAAAIAARAAVDTAITGGAVAGLLAARDMLADQDLLDLGDTVMVVAVALPASAAPEGDITWNVAWVGDCRAYLDRGGVLRQVTRDHTQGQYLRDRGRTEAVASRFDHIVVTTVGSADSDTLGKADVAGVKGRLVLVSDGVGKALPHADIAAVVTTSSAADTCARRLAELGAQVDRADNSTAMVIDHFTI